MSVFHTHHIVPLHMGGTDDPSNLVKVSVEEHAKRHMDLYETYGHIEDLIAYKSLSSQMTMEDRIVELAKLGGSKGKNNPKKMGKNNSFYGKKHTEKTKKIIGEKSRKINTGRRAWNRGKTGLFFHTQEFKEKLSKERLGKPRIGFIPWNKGKKGCQIPWNKGLKLKEKPFQ